MKAILATKQGMSQIYTEDGVAIPVTVLKATPNTVTLVRTVEKDGYEAIQVGAGEQSMVRLKKPQVGQLKDIGAFQVLREVKSNDEVKVGDLLKVDMFNVGDSVDIASISKGKGFQGVVKRHGFHGGPKSHGQKHTLRAPGSIGAGGSQRVLKGTRMAGRMGGKKVTVKNLQVAHVDPQNNLLYVKGAVPGRRGMVVEVIAK
jgi:large subunit ribosomal protein L3